MSRGDGELEAQQFSRACDSYLAATDHYWLALSRANCHVPERRVLANAHVSAFRAALPLLSHPAAPFDLEVDQARVTGYVFRPRPGADLVRPAIWAVGRDATAESSYRQVALTILGSNLACAVYSVEVSRRHQLAAGRPLSAPALQCAVVQWVQEQPGVDPDAEPMLVPTN
jgi:hypothetical protein